MDSVGMPQEFNREEKWRQPETDGKADGDETANEPNTEECGVAISYEMSEIRFNPS